MQVVKCGNNAYCARELYSNYADTWTECGYRINVADRDFFDSDVSVCAATTAEVQEKHPEHLIEKWITLTRTRQFHITSAPSTEE